MDNQFTLLKKHFGYDAFRPGQAEIVKNILMGRDTFAVMPTGAGKSICYQVPALMLPGITLVISPLISLMQDQVKSLNEAGISAAYLNSSLTEGQFAETIRRGRKNTYKIIYVAPERLETESFKSFALSVEISMVTVDEAHCISQWGQDFRPSYLKIVEFIKYLKVRPIISAFTATATKPVREDIICTLGLNEPYTLVLGFDRENLFFQVETPKNKNQYVLDYLSEHREESGIIYCSTRKNVEKLYDLLCSRGFSTAKYHAGMGAQERKSMQDDFVYDFKNIIIATNAFGMGIDKSNVRFVIHYNMPQSMENYYQEAGRAGRDGLEAKCILLFSPQDIVINRFLLESREMEEMEPEDKESIMERDNMRLQFMERYCRTTECLRKYILGYFGEKREGSCNNCFNCLREFEEIDMTNEAKQIINCIYEAKGRFGENVIVDTLAGAKTAKLEEYGTIHYRTYGILKDWNRNLLKRLVSQMIAEEYIEVRGQYRLLKIGPAMSELKKDNARVMLRVPKGEEKKKKPGDGEPKKQKAADVLTSAGYELFGELKALRIKFAREENMPPYIIFNDKTLIDMCVKMPKGRASMLRVSGVGERKYERYGEAFLSLIKKYEGKQTAIVYDERQDSEDYGDEPDFYGYDEGEELPEKFFITKEQAGRFRYLSFLVVEEITEELNSLRDEKVKNLFQEDVWNFLYEEDLIQEVHRDGVLKKEITDKGKSLGIFIADKISGNGIYPIPVIPRNVQEIIVGHFSAD